MLADLIAVTECWRGLTLCFVPSLPGSREGDPVRMVRLEAVTLKQRLSEIMFHLRQESYRRTNISATEHRPTRNSDNPRDSLRFDVDSYEFFEKVTSGTHISWSWYAFKICNLADFEFATCRVQTYSVCLLNFRTRTGNLLESNAWKPSTKVELRVAKIYAILLLSCSPWILPIVRSLLCQLWY